MDCANRRRRPPTSSRCRRGRGRRTQGITWLNASGDSGGADCLTGSSERPTRGGFAADIPEVTGIGGTTFSEAAGNYWNATERQRRVRCSPTFRRRCGTMHERRPGGGRRGRQCGARAAGVAGRLGRAEQWGAKRSGYLACGERGSRWIPGLHGRPATGFRRDVGGHAYVRRNYGAAQSLPGRDRRAIRAWRRQRESAAVRTGAGGHRRFPRRHYGEQYRYGDLRNALAELRPRTWGYAAGQGCDQASGLGSVDATIWSPAGTLRPAQGERRRLSRCRRARLRWHPQIR